MTTPGNETSMHIHKQCNGLHKTKAQKTSLTCSGVECDMGVESSDVHVVVSVVVSMLCFVVDSRVTLTKSCMMQ